MGTLVVEAAPKSGSLITARLAGEAGREVMAIPGSPLDARSHGCNQLIRDGATLVQDAAEVIEALGGFAPPPIAPVTASLAEATEPMESDRSRLLTLLGRAAVTVDELMRQAELPHPAVQTMLLELELAGRVERHAGGKVSLVM